MKESKGTPKPQSNRRSFLKNGMLAAGVATVGGGLLTKASAFSRDQQEGSLTPGDAAILQLLLAAEIIETDLWQQYNELGGVAAPDSTYVAALKKLDGDMPQYISDNTDDEMSHVSFLTAYLLSKGHQPVNLDQFRTLHPSKAPGASQGGRLTNLMQLSVDTTWWTRYRSKENPDLGARFPQAVPSLAQGKFPAIPTNGADLGDPTTITDHIQAIANTAGFHFGFIEQAGTSLYATLSQRVSSPEVLRITIGIGGSEIMHFQVWHDKAGNAVPLTDGALTFVDLTQNQPESLQANLIMPEPCDFIKGLPECAIIRPTGAGQLDAVGAINGFFEDGLFAGQQDPRFKELLFRLANAADQAQREL